MRGSPLLRAAVAFFILLLLGLPLWRLTDAGATAAPEPPKAPETAAADAAAKPIHLQLDFTLPPKVVRVLALGKEVWSDSAPLAKIEKDLPIAYPEQGVDLQFHVEWADDAPLAAMRATLTDPAGDAHEKSLWGQGPVDGVLTFP